MASRVDNSHNELLAGISVACEPVGPSTLSSTVTCSVSTITGIVKVKTDNTTVSQLRDILRRELPALPVEFCFLTKQGWPVREEQEGDIKILDLLDSRSLITIRRCFAQPRVLIRNLSHEVLGFIFINYNNSILELRQALREQLTFLTPDPLFLDARGCPVQPAQEKDLLTWDLVCDGYITMRSSIAESFSNYSHSHSEIQPDTPDGPGKKRKISEWNGSSHTLSSRSLFEKENGNLPRVLISYVRAEAAKHAKDLKWELTENGYHVFLDVDEIYGGRDWQDALNEAVQNCTLFIPLITPQYGKTKWTNREVKLADQLKKQIIPVNFLHTWPPPCLAIQFASLHFLPWKTVVELEQEKLEVTETRANDIRFWDAPYIKRVVESITDCFQEYRHYYDSQELSQNEDENTSTVLKRSRSHLSLPLTPIGDIEFEKPIVPKPLVVLSAHPNDEECITNIRTVLNAENFDVWASSDSVEEFETLGSYQPSPMTPLPPSFPDSGPIPLTLNTQSQESTCGEAFNHNTVKRRPSLLFSYSIDGKSPSYNRSDSQMTSSPIAQDKLNIFRCRANKAKVVIILLSKDYCRAKTSQKQVFYCEQRKIVIPVQVRDFQLPAYIINLFGNDILQYENTPEFFEELKYRVKSDFDVNIEKPKICPKEVRLQSEVLKLKRQINNQNCIYVMGSTRICNARTENICIAIGQELAACSFLSLATNGFYGVSENVGRSFCEEQDLRGTKPALLYNVLPNKDSKDMSKISRQAVDGKFLKLPYGQTIYSGNSVCERDTIVARTFHVCLLIEGNDESAREAEQFTWHDNIVIPIVSTGGAAAGEYGSLNLDVPPGVSEADWKLLSRKDEPVEEIAQAVKRILCSLKSKEVASKESTKPGRGKRSNRKSTKPSHT